MNRDFSKLVDRSFDVLVCGGGIYGAWTAYDAALRGFKVAIVDQGDWASATSSASSKLIHGGLRYLESLDFKLVKKSLRERQMLMKAAPHRVWPLRFGVPVFTDSRFGSIRLIVGLTLYDLLAGIAGTGEAHRHFSRSEFAHHFPCLVHSKLRSGFTYLDAQTDDARFVLELIDGASEAGAICVNYCEATDFIDHQGQVCGARLHDKVSGKAERVHARQIVYATGQWLAGEQLAQVKLTKGIHLILPNVLGSEALLLTAQQDGRVFFIIPWYGLTLLGTTDTPYTGDVDRLTIGKDDIDYLLNEANRALKVHWTEADIIGRYAGLRVLKQSQALTPSAMSRDWELKIADNGLLVSAGGKFTSAREDAAHIVDTICHNLKRDKPCQTFARPFPWLPDADFQQWQESAGLEAAKLGIDDVCAHWLIRRHASRVAKLFALVDNNPELAKRIFPELPFIYADLILCARTEMVIHLEDVLRRRMPLLVLTKMTRAEIAHLAGIVAQELDWSRNRMEEEIENCSRKWLEIAVS